MATTNWILNVQPGNLNRRKNEISEIAKKLFDYFTSLPQDIRPEEDGKIRTGIFIYAEVPGTRNIFRISIGDPSEAAISFAQTKCNMIRFNECITSRDVANPKENLWPGAISCYAGSKNPEEFDFHIGVSGLKAEEDEVIALILAATITGYFVPQLVDEIKHFGGSLEANIENEKHYLNQAIRKFSPIG